MLCRSFLPLLFLVVVSPVLAQPTLLATYTFDTAASIDEWERFGPGFVPPDLWGDINWDRRDGHPAPGSMELVKGPGAGGLLAALGPCFSDLPFGDSSVIEINAMRKNVTDSCGFGFFGYLAADCTDFFGSTSNPSVNPDGVGVWLLYRNQLRLSQPQIKSLRPIASTFASPRESCKVDTIQVILTPPTPADVPMHPAALSLLVVTLAGVAIYFLRLRA